MTNIEPKFEPLAFSKNDMPEMPMVCAHARRLAGKLVDLAHHFLRALAPTRRRATARSPADSPWSCCGMNPVGICAKPQYVSPSSPP